jgi:hypothetical protein
MFIPTFWMPTQVRNFQRMLADTYEYRLHTIKIGSEGAKRVASIYDGTRPVFKTYGIDTEQALRAAKQWIDEQDEVMPTYDLHDVR